MVGKNIIKLIKSLQQKKFRNEHQLFVVEGFKSVDELLASPLKCYGLYVLSDYYDRYAQQNAALISTKELMQMSSLKKSPGVLGVFYQPKLPNLTYEGWSVVLDDVRDPGNLGTIIRLCDWFGIQQLVCSNQTVDCYNPKTLQATMGSISRVAVHYTELDEFLAKSTIPIYGTYMDGASIYTSSLAPEGLLLMGNEANGIGEQFQKYISKKISIPSFGSAKTESLNVAMATGICLSELRRNTKIKD